MFDRSKLLKSTKGKLAISGLVLALGLSGCSFNLNKSGDNKVLIETNKAYDYELENDRIDNLMGFTNDIEDNDYLDYTYLIDNSETTVATFAHVIDEKTITSNGKLFDGKEERESAVFEEDIIQPIVTPKAFFLYNVDDISTLVESYGDCDITGKKMITLEGEVLYYFESVLTFNDFAHDIIDLDIKDGDTITAKALYRLNPNGQLELLYKTQEGYKEDTPNIVEANYNDSSEVVIPLDKTIFADMDGKYSESEAENTLKEYKKY